MLLLLLACVTDPPSKDEPADDSGPPIEEIPDADQDGFDAAADCDDANASVHPGASELCNGLDDDCDLDTDEDATDAAEGFPDGDADGFGVGDAPVRSCAGGLAASGGDCDDTDASVWPGAAEITNDGVDQDCDGADANCPGADLGAELGATGGLSDAADLLESACAPGAPEATFVWTAPANGLWTFAVEADFNAAISAHEATCGGEEYACAAGPLLRMWLRTGQTVQLAVASTDGGSGNFTLSIDTLTPEFGRLAAGGALTCALDGGGGAACYGSAFRPASPGPFDFVESGPSGGCGIDAAGAMTCWGTNTYGEATPPADTWAMLSSGLGISYCGLTRTGAIRCWGEPVNGSLSAPSDLDQQLISLGYYGGASLDLRGHVAVWGQRTFGMLPAPEARFLQISTGRSFVCGVLEDLSLSCWGTASWGVTSPPSGEFVSVAAGYSHACALAVDGSIACWGFAWGSETTPPAGAYVDLSLGQAYGCARRESGEVDCWGDNSYGQGEVP